MPSFAACDLCLASLRTRFMEVQVSPGTIVQISEDGDVAHRRGRLRSYRLCEECGRYLHATVEALAARGGRGSGGGAARAG